MYDIFMGTRNIDGVFELLPYVMGEHVTIAGALHQCVRAQRRFDAINVRFYVMLDGTEIGSSIDGRYPDADCVMHFSV